MPAIARSVVPARSECWNTSVPACVAAGRPDLAGRIRWVSHLDGDGAGFDIQSFETDGSSRLVEVKTTNGWERTPFQITRNELAVAEARRENWRLAGTLELRAGTASVRATTAA